MRTISEITRLPTINSSFSSDYGLALQIQAEINKSFL